MFKLFDNFVESSIYSIALFAAWAESAFKNQGPVQIVAYNIGLRVQYKYELIVIHLLTFFKQIGDFIYLFI